LAKWASGTRHWLHYWRGSPDYAQASSVLWQDDPAWGAFWGRIPSYLHAGLGMLVLGAGLLLVGKRVKA
jgi:hypothetical protein